MIAGPPVFEPGGPRGGEGKKSSPREKKGGERKGGSRGGCADLQGGRGGGKGKKKGRKAEGGKRRGQESAAACHFSLPRLRGGEGPRSACFPIIFPVVEKREGERKKKKAARKRPGSPYGGAKGGTKWRRRSFPLSNLNFQ